MPPMNHDSLEKGQLNADADIQPMVDGYQSPGSTSKELRDVSHEFQGLPLIRSLLYEILCLVVATASLLGLVALLRKYENQESPEWSAGRVGVTLNTVISILSTLFEGSLLTPVAQCISQLCWTWYAQPRPLSDISYYDSASRGSVGSFVLLLSIGAIITISALALDPFFQQTVRYISGFTIDSSRQAQAVVAHTYAIDNSPTGEFANAYGALPYDMKVATYNGLLSSSLISLPVPPFNFPTGNCTWDPFGTLAVSSDCVSITDHVSLNCTSAEGPGCQFITTDKSLQPLINNSTSSSTFYLESGLSRSFLPVLQSYANVTGYLAMVQWVKAIGPLGAATEEIEAGWIMSNTTFEANVAHGVYSEDVLQEYTRSDIQFLTPTYHLNSTKTNYFFLDPFASDATDTFIYSPPFGKTMPSVNDTFTVTWNIFEMLASQLIHLPNGNVDTSFSSGPEGTTDIALMLYESDNVTQAMQNMAHYMTTSIRSVDSLALQQRNQNETLVAPQQAISGYFWVQKPFVVVQWAWLALPVILLALAILLLIFTFWETKASGVGF